MIGIPGNQQIQYSMPKIIKVWCINGRVEKDTSFEVYKELINRNFRAIIDTGKQDSLAKCLQACSALIKTIMDEEPGQIQEWNEEEVFQIFKVLIVDHLGQMPFDSDILKDL